MLCRVYSCDIDDEDKLKYMDEDGDWVTVQDSADLQFALQSVQQRNVSTLRLRIGGNQSGVPDEIVNELRSIRDMSITLLDRLAKSGNSSQTTPSPQKQEKAETPTRTPVVSEVTPVVSNHEDIKTFDPIGEKQEESIAYVEPISPAVPTPVVVESVPVVEPVPPPEPVLQPMIPPPVEQAPVVPTPIIPPAEPVQIAPVVPIVPVVQQQPPPEPEKSAPVQPVIPSGNLSAFKQEPTAASFFNTPSSASTHSNDGFNTSDRGSATNTPKPIVPAANASPSPVVPPSSTPQSTNLHGQQQYNYPNPYMQQTQQTAPPVQQTPSPAPTQQTQQPVQPNQYYQQYQQPTYGANPNAYNQYYQHNQQAYNQPPQQSAAPVQQQQMSAPPSGPPQVTAPPQGMPQGGYRLQRNTRNVRPGYQ